MKLFSRLKLGDICLMIFILLISALMFIMPLLKPRATSAEILIAQAEEKIVYLNTNTEFDITSRGINLTICIENGEIFVKYSDCKDEICQNTPPISRAGQSIVCAPAGVVIRISGEGGVVDGVSG